MEFHPTPAATASAVTALYDVPATLVVRFASDSIDESPRLVQLLASTPGAVSVDEAVLDGNHLTPLVQDVFGDAGGVGDMLLRRGLAGGVLAQVDALVDVIDAWVTEGLRDGTI